MVDEEMAGATLTAVTTENATSVTVDDDRFEVADGNLKLKDDMSLDFEGDDGGSVVVTITASGDGESAEHPVTVTINDVNEMPTIDVRDGEVVPQKDVTSSLTIDESVMGSDLPPLALIEVMDADAADATTGQDGADMVMISGAMADYFEVKLDPENGLWLALKADASLDYETVGSSVMLTVTYTDSAGQSASADVTVMINNVNEAAMVNGEVGDMTFVGGAESSMEVDLKALFMDPDGDGLTYRLSDNALDWLTLSVTTTGTGDDRTIMGTLSGMPAAGAEGEVEGVSIIASDDDGAEAHAMFDLIIDAANDAPDRLELRVTDDDGLVIRTTEANVDENAMGVVLGDIYLRDPDDARHPHGQHEYSFSDDRFEVADGMLKLKDDASLDRETDGSEIDLTVTATDMAEGDAAESISLMITIMIGNVDTGTSEGPRRARDSDGELREIEAITITVDDDLEDDVDDVDAGDWLKMIPSGLSMAFEDPDGDDLTYSLGSGAPRWLQIDEDTGELTNAEETVPNRGVYDVSIVASDDDGNSASANVQIAVALSGPNDSDNDEPRIRNINERDFTEGDESGPVVATFEVDDDDIEIAPHPYGIHEVEFTAMQDPGDGSDEIDVTNAFKIEWVRDDGDDTAYYEIRAKTPAELAMGADGDDTDKDPDVYPANHAMAGEVIPVDPIDYEAGDEIEFVVTVTDMDGDGEEDVQDIDIDVEDAADESPVFQPAATGGSRNAMEMTTTISVNQQTDDRTILVMRVDELWEDADTDDDDLDIDVGGTSGLPDWIKVYGPDRWDDIYENRRTDITDAEVDRVTDIRDRDEVILIVIDRTDGTKGENVSLDGGSFTISADDGDGNMATETIMLSVTNTNVAPPDATKVVSISGGDPNDDDEVTGTGNLMMNVNFNLDPDLAGGETPYLVLYTWMVSSDDTDDGDDTNGPEDEDIISVSASPHPLMLGVMQADGTMARNTAYIDQTITAKVEVFEVDPATGKITPMGAEYMATVEVASAADAPVVPPPATSVSFGDITTDTTGVVVTITATGEAAEAGTARLQSSTSGNDPKGTDGWINVDSSAADTSTTPADVDLDVDANADGTTTGGDGGGLYYRVVYEYDDDGDDAKEYSDVIQLGSVATDPADITLLGPTAPASGDTVRVNNLTATVTVQWQMGMDEDESGTIDADEWMDLAGETGHSLTLTDDHAGNSVRALLTHKGDEDNPSHVTWVDYSAVAAVAALPTSPNNTPVRQQETYWIEVNLNSDDDEGTGTGNVASLFFDSDGDDLTYSLVGTSVDDAPGGGIQDGNTVYRSGDDDQILTLNKDSGAITYYTNNGMVHDDDTTDSDGDGAGNWLTVTVEASDGKPDTTDDTSDDVTVYVRVNVAPTGIGLGAGGTDIEDDATATPTASGFTFDETDNYSGTDSVVLDVKDLNLITHSYGTHTMKVDDDRFELERVDGTDMSQWTLTVKDGAEFDYEDDDNPSGLITIKVTATDGGGKSTVGYISVQLGDVTGDTDPQASGSGAGNGGVMTTGGGAGDDDAPGNAPGDGGLWIDSDFMEVDLFESYMLIIDDIDIA